MDQNVTCLVCIRVEDLEPQIISWKDTCSECGAKVWRADKVSVDKVICVQCALVIMEKGGEGITIMPATEEQLQTIRSSLTRVKN